VKRLHILYVFAFMFLFPVASLAQQVDPSMYQSMRWRMIGPFRGGRTVGATGVPSQPNVFYIGVNNGGVWKTTDYGRTWFPIFDDEPTGSIGALAVAPSNPDIIYVGSGEGLQRPDLSTGDGIYKSVDAGKTWKHLGLRDGQQIGAIIVDPRDPQRLFVAVLGHPYGPNEERGVFRSTDGGETFQKVLYKDENTGAIALAFDPKDPGIIYADLWAGRQGPWENGAWQGPNSGLFKSTDGGNTWRQLTNGLPTTQQGLGRIGFAIAPSDSNTLYALVDAPQLGGLFRSDDAGETWRRICTDPRIWGRGSDFAEVKVDPRNKEVVYSANVATYKSTDGGKSFTAFKGAPGGDDYHTLWINPETPQIMLLASDQGAVVTVNGGDSWSSWYNQPTAQFYHVNTDNQFPYWVYGGQQESGSAAVVSRGDSGAITARDWRTVGVEEYGYVAPDPLNPHRIFGGRITRFDKRTGQVQNVSPEPVRSGKYRVVRTAPVIFSPVDPHVLFYAANVLFKTTDGGNSWQTISPDLSRERPEVPASIGIFRKPEMATQQRRGVIYTVAPSYKDVNVIWAGTDDGLIHITRNGGKSWQNVTPPAIDSWSKVSIIDAGRFDADTAYAAVNRIRLDDQRPHIYRTHDGGKNWKEITNGLPENAPVNVIREDPVRKGLLFAGTERAVYASFDDGDNWQQLRLNMPATSIRDLVIHRDDVVVGTHGRSFWILDDITPLRQISSEMSDADALLFAPQQAYRYRRSVNTDTPLPPDEPVGQNPPDGAIINYYLKSDSSGPVTIEVLDRTGGLIRRFSSQDLPRAMDERDHPITTAWMKLPQMLSTKAGMQRFVWDLRYPPPNAKKFDYPISAVYKDTPPHPEGPLVMPGDYRIRLTVNGKTYEKPLKIVMDPRVDTPPGGLKKQFELSMQAYKGLNDARAALDQLHQVRVKLDARQSEPAASELNTALQDLKAKVQALEGDENDARSASTTNDESMTKVYSAMASLLDLFQEADYEPTTQAVAASTEWYQKLESAMQRWRKLQNGELAEINRRLSGAGLQQISVE
jgi:photosystem II stability/assembly factor-like uncharacterized protein